MAGYRNRMASVMGCIVQQLGMRKCGEINQENAKARCKHSSGQAFAERNGWQYRNILGEHDNLRAALLNKPGPLPCGIGPLAGRSPGSRLKRSLPAFPAIGASGNTGAPLPQYSRGVGQVTGPQHGSALPVPFSSLGSETPYGNHLWCQTIRAATLASMAEKQRDGDGGGGYFCNRLRRISR